MKTILASTAVALVALVGFAAPAFADDDTSPSFNETTVLNTLQGRGVNAVEAEKWGDRILVDVLLADGSTQQQLFDLSTYEPVGANNRPTRVLTVVDTGVPAAPAGDSVPQSLSDPNDLD